MDWRFLDQIGRDFLLTRTAVIPDFDVRLVVDLEEDPFDDDLLRLVLLLLYELLP